MAWPRRGNHNAGNSDCLSCLAIGVVLFLLFSWVCWLLLGDALVKNRADERRAYLGSLANIVHSFVEDDTIKLAHARQAFEGVISLSSDLAVYDLELAREDLDEDPHAAVTSMVTILEQHVLIFEKGNLLETAHEKIQKQAVSEAEFLRKKGSDTGSGEYQELAKELESAAKASQHTWEAAEKANGVVKQVLAKLKSALTRASDAEISLGAERAAEILRGVDDDVEKLLPVLEINAAE